MISSAKACLISILLICVFVPVFAGLYTPQDFVSGTLVRVPDGASFYEIAGQLKKDNVIASIHTLRFFSFLFGGTHKIQAGTYMFTKPQGSVYIAQRLIKGRTDIPEVKVLIPEGKNAKEIAAILSLHIPALDPEEFIRESQSSEGYLFPDTYRFFITATTGEVITHLKETFVERTTLLETLRSDFDKPFPDVVIMASLLEEEVRGMEDKRIVSGILWKRINMEMPLQVDAPFAYILGKTSEELTREDLAFDSPYNTYLNTGLPPTPITNPGLESLEAALRPIETPYVFYLTDKEGTVYYAETFEEHVGNKKRYLQ